MAIFLAEICLTGQQIIVDEGSLTLVINDFCSVDDGSGNISCVKIIDNSIGSPSYTAQTIYTDCYDCASSNNLNVIITDCKRGTKYSVPYSGFSSPLYEETYYFSLDSGRGKSLELCAFVTNFTSSDIEYYITNSTFYLNCFGCSISANSTSYLVEQCNTGTQYYILLPVNYVAGGFISFNPLNSLDQLCGTIVNEEPGEIPTAIYLADFNDCEECLDQISVRRIIESCIDGTQEVVFASALYNLNESSFLTINDPSEGFSGCYKIGDITTSAVTVTGYLSYSPSPSCDECISCNGFEFVYSVCGEPLLTGSTYSNQYIEVGQSFYHPISGCCQVDEIITANTSSEQFLSFYEYTNCEECTGTTTTYESWVATDCYDSSVLVVRIPTGFSSGDRVTIKKGLLTISCVELNTLYVDEAITTFAITTEVSYADCPTCWANTFVAYPFVNCETNTPTYFSISLENYYIIAESKTGNIFNTPTFGCYYRINGCAVPNYSEIIPTNFFSNCTECNAPLSAGTAAFICNICCPCTTGATVTAVAAPHPTWTNQYGKSVSLLDSILLGGQNGLNM